MKSPFPHQGPLLPAQVTGRDDLVADLIERITARQVTALLGPRRYGKTSVLRKVSALLEETGISTIWVDLYEVTSAADLAIRLDRALDTTKGRLGELVRTIAASVSFVVGGVNVSFARPQRPDPVATLHVLLDLLVKGALSHPTVVVFDEFSSINRIDGAAGLLRTQLQHHYSDMGLVFAGSEPSTMKSLFSDGEQPFYGQADLVTIGSLSASAVQQIVTHGFRSTDRDPGSLPMSILGFCRGHPRRTMQYADAAWRLAEPGRAWDDAVWTQTVARLAGSLGPGLESLYSNLPVAEQKALRIIANDGSVWGRDAELLRLAPTSARAALRSLVDRGHITGTTSPGLVDPVFADWLRRNLPIT